MNIIRMLSWNVNGLRAINKKGFRAWLERDSPHILCIQETKVNDKQVPPELKNIPGYYSYFSSGDKKGYGGVGLFTRMKPNNVSFSLALEDFNDENRVIKADFGSFELFNVYFPNGKASNERLKYKLKFYDGFLDIIDNLKVQEKNIVICGDFNTAHEEKDLARPKQNEKISGFLPIERAWMNRFISHGFLDTFRLFHQEGTYYSWWDLKTKARERDVGWRIDYFFVSESLRDRVKSAFILKEVKGSDHCPVGLEMTFEDR